MNKLVHVYLLICAVAITGCGGGSGSSSTTTGGTTGNSTGYTPSGSNSSGVTRVADLPRVTDAVSTGTSDRALKRSSTTPSTTGLPFATAHTDNFSNVYDPYLGEADISTFFPDSATGSYAACDLLNFARGAYAQAAEGDMIMCIVTEAVGELTSDDYQYKSMEFTEGSDTITYKMKFRQTTNDAGEITSFEMFGCSDDNEATNMVQDMYFLQDYSGDNVVMLVKGSTEPGNPDVDQVTYQVDVTADGINSSGEIVGTKVMAVRYQNLFSDNVLNHSVMDLTLTNTEFKYNGYFCDKNSSASTTCDAHGGGTAIFASMDILNNNETGENNLNKFALGDGAAYLHTTDNSINGIQIWDADSGTVNNSDTGLSHYAYVVNNISSAKAVSASYDAVTFNSDQTWDCSDTAQALQVSMSTMGACFAEREIDQDVHLECGGGPGGSNLSTSVIALP